MKVELINYTKDAEDLLIFAKRTRRMDGTVQLHEIHQSSQQEKEEELKYIFSTISGPWEFVDYTFFISGVTRAFTHQLVRHRVGTSFAQESMRIADKEDFEYLNEVPQNILFESTMKIINNNYKSMLNDGIQVQRARGILPTNILTNILVKINLRAINNMMNTRLCVRVADEFQKVAKSIREEIVKIHPWAERALLPFCIEWGVCKFQNFKGCPIKMKFPSLNKNHRELSSIKKFWEETIDIYSPQPK